MSYKTMIYKDVLSQINVVLRLPVAEVCNFNKIGNSDSEFFGRGVIRDILGTSSDSLNNISVGYLVSLILTRAGILNTELDKIFIDNLQKMVETISFAKTEGKEDYYSVFNECYACSMNLKEHYKIGVFFGMCSKFFDTVDLTGMLYQVAVNLFLLVFYLYTDKEILYFRKKDSKPVFKKELTILDDSLILNDVKGISLCLSGTEDNNSLACFYSTNDFKYIVSDTGLVKNLNKFTKLMDKHMNIFEINVSIENKMHWDTFVKLYFNLIFETEAKGFYFDTRFFSDEMLEILENTRLYRDLRVVIPTACEISIIRKVDFYIQDRLVLFDNPTKIDLGKSRYNYIKTLYGTELSNFDSENDYIILHETVLDGELHINCIYKYCAITGYFDICRNTLDTFYKYAVSGTLAVLSIVVDILKGEHKQVVEHGSGESQTTYISYNTDRKCWDTKLVVINAYVRKLPTGQIASETAIELAKKLKIHLREGYTIVKPFTKNVYISK